MQALLPCLAALLEDEQHQMLADSVFGSHDPALLAATVEACCQRFFNEAVAGCHYFMQSVGAVFCLGLASGRSVVLKFHQPRQDLAALEAMTAIQRELHAAGFPCPQPLLQPQLFEGIPLSLEAYAADGEYRDAHEPEVRTALARALAELLCLSAPLAQRLDISALPVKRACPADRLWPVPHNALFDFEATTAGAEWIDAIAAEARAELLPWITRTSPDCIGHFDWCGKHFRFAGETMTAVYD